MWIFDLFSPYSYQNNMEKYKDDDEKRYFNFKECLWFCMTSLTPQVRQDPTIVLEKNAELGMRGMFTLFYGRILFSRVRYSISAMLLLILFS